MALLSGNLFNTTLDVSKNKQKFNLSEIQRIIKIFRILITSLLSSRIMNEMSRFPGFLEEYLNYHPAL